MGNYYRVPEAWRTVRFECSLNERLRGDNMFWLAQAPANIALIKYMGKKDESINLPDNASLSYTLSDLISTVKLESLTSKKDLWEPLNIPGSSPFELSLEGQKRFITHLQRMKDYFGYTGGFVIQSSNNFPHSTGLASSASSFAALTKCSILALSELTEKPIPPVEEQAQLSRQGSGSSCRSFYAPWVLWKNKSVKSIDLPYKNLIHQVVLVNSQEKKVLSKEAHKKVKTSPHYAARPNRAEDNLKVLLNAFKAEDWESAYHICWKEFQDMHLLFSTAEQPFTYMNEKNTALLNDLQRFWEKHKDGPIVTMDAGPNVHLLYRPDQEELANRFKQHYLVGNYDVL